MKNSIYGIILIALTGYSCAYNASKPDPIELTYRFSKSVIPPSCESLAVEAENKFNAKWVAHLLSPAETILIEPTEHPTEKDRRYLAPVGTEVVFYSQPQLSGQFASLFLDCKRRQAYVLARGGIRDVSTWHGPFKF